MSALDPERAARLADQLDDFRRTLDSIEIVGFPKPATEHAQLAELIERYPEQARALLRGP
jgi:hypothetical protein